jgi:cytochrome P450
MKKFFSRAQVSTLECEIQQFAQQLCDKILARRGGKSAIDIAEAYSCFTTDVIAKYAFGETFGFLSQEAFEPNYRPAAYSLLNSLYVFRFFPFLKIFVYITP